MIALLDMICVTNMRTVVIAAHSVFKYVNYDTKILCLMGYGFVCWFFKNFIGNLSDTNYTIVCSIKEVKQRKL